MTSTKWILGALACASVMGFAQSTEQSNPLLEYKILATQRTSTMEDELNEAGEEGYSFRAVMGGETATLGNEAVVLLSRPAGDKSGQYRYMLLATNKTSTMEKELNEVGREGYAFVGHTVFETLFGGREVVVILQRDLSIPAQRIEYKLLATNRTSTLERELNQAGAEGFVAQDLSVAKTSFGGDELVTILMRIAE